MFVAPLCCWRNGNSLVPNDIYLGGGTTMSHPRALLLTGPNMGGKSTLLCATCLAVILAQALFLLSAQKLHRFFGMLLKILLCCMMNLAEGQVHLMAMQLPMLCGTVNDTMGTVLCKNLCSIGWLVTHFAILRNEVDSVAEEVETPEAYK